MKSSQGVAFVDTAYYAKLHLEENDEMYFLEKHEEEETLYEVLPPETINKVIMSV